MILLVNTCSLVESVDWGLDLEILQNYRKKKIRGFIATQMERNGSARSVGLFSLPGGGDKDTSVKRT